MLHGTSRNAPGAANSRVSSMTRGSIGYPKNQQPLVRVRVKPFRNQRAEQWTTSLFSLYRIGRVAENKNGGVR